MAITKYIVLHVLSLPALILGFLYTGFTLITYMSHNLRIEWPSLTVYGSWRPWVLRATGGRMPSFTLGTAFMLSDPAHISHERVHVRQFQDVAVQGFALGTAFAIALLDPWALLAWPAMLITMLTYYLSAWLRGAKNVLIEAEHEAAAYGRTR